MGAVRGVRTQNAAIYRLVVAHQGIKMEKKNSVPKHAQAAKSVEKIVVSSSLLRYHVCRADFI